MRNSRAICRLPKRVSINILGNLLCATLPMSELVTAHLHRTYAVDALPDATESQLRHAADLRFAVRDSRSTAAAAAERDRRLEDDLQDALYVSRNDAARRAHVARDLRRMTACNK